MSDDFDLDPRDDGAVLRQLGADLAAARLARNWSQLELAERAGVGKRTIERLERGESSTTANLVRVLRALGLLGVLGELTPQAAGEPSPLERLQAARQARRRASPARSHGDPAGEEPFRWGDEAGER